MVTGGAGRRFQPSLAKNNITFKAVRDNCHTIKNSIKNLRRDMTKDYQQETTKSLRKYTDTVFSTLNRNCKHMGVLSLAHIVYPLALLAQAPMHLLSFAVAPENAAQFKKDNMSPAMTRYMNSAGDEADGSNKKGKLAVILASITRFLRVKMGIPHLSEALVENISCEASCRMVTHDHYFAGNWFFRHKPADVSRRGHTE